MIRKLLLTAAGAALVGWALWGNSALQVSEYDVLSSRLPDGFEGFRIAQISDLHNVEFGNNNEKLLSAIAGMKPDIIVFTGDLIDCRNLNIPVAVSFAQAAGEIAPCYFAAGNHEARIPEFPELVRGLASAGVTVLRNEKIGLTRNGDTITLMGVDDPTFQVDYITGDCRPVMTAALTRLMEAEQNYTVLLSHRPELASIYRNFSVDLTFSGHAHGGQFRLPFIGGLIAPNQGFFPKYDAGVFTEDSGTMVVSRGLGPSIVPLRIGNRPEVVVAELHRQER